MLDPSETASLIPLSYRSHTVRIHRHSESSIVYFVLADVCKVLNLSTPSYVARKIDKRFKHKHKILNNGVKNIVEWVNYDGLIQLFETLPNNKGYGDFWAWCRDVALS